MALPREEPEDVLREPWLPLQQRIRQRRDAKGLDDRLRPGRHKTQTVIKTRVFSARKILVVSITELQINACFKLQLHVPQGRSFGGGQHTRRPPEQESQISLKLPPFRPLKCGCNSCFSIFPACASHPLRGDLKTATPIPARPSRQTT
jgi:hypothetical protein